MQKYFITGSTSGTGHAVLKKIVEKLAPQQITCLVRETSDISIHKELGVPTVYGDVLKPETYKRFLDSKVIFVDMTHPKHYHISLETIQKSGIERAYFVTTTGIFSSYNQFSNIYKINEAKIRQSGITYTILRPSMIYGHARDRNMSKLIRFLKRYPVFPIFNGGHSLMQPVFVDDLANGIVSTIDNAQSENQEYNLCGPVGLSYQQLIKTILSALERNVVLLNVPSSVALVGARIGSHIRAFP